MSRVENIKKVAIGFVELWESGDHRLAYDELMDNHPALVALLTATMASIMKPAEVQSFLEYLANEA